MNRQMIGYDQNDIICVPSRNLDVNQFPVGFSPCKIEDLERHIIRSEEIRAEPRNRVEDDKELRQLVVYAVIIQSGGVLRYRRGQKSNEARLRNKWSIGIGGHVEAQDLQKTERGVDLRQTLALACDRELREELIVEEMSQPQFLGILHDDSNDVALVHLGLVYAVKMPNTTIRSREDGLLDFRVESHQLLRDCGASYETWSELLLPHLDIIEKMCN